MPDDRDDSASDDVLRIVRFDEIHEPAPEAGHVELSAVAERREPRLTEAIDVETGFNRSGAISELEAIQIARGGVAGVEVMHSMCNRPLYSIQHWRCERGANEPYGVFCRRSLQLAEEFLVSYPDPGDGSMTYVLHASADEAPNRVA